MAQNLGDNLVYSTTRISSDAGAIGTGFFVSFSVNESDQYIPVLVTNKHVIQDANIIEFLITVENKDTGERIKKFPVQVSDIQKMFLLHPDDEVDLCVLPIAGVLEHLREKNLSEVIFPFHESIIYKSGSNNLGNISAIQEIHMTGYPSGLWDDVNNKPITRKGITASSVKQNWQGKKEFLADITCFPGSSGSPIYIYDDGMFMDGKSAKLGERLILLGILYAGPTFTAEGEIRAVKIPTNYKSIAVTELMMNLGFIIKAEELFVIKDMILDIIKN
ncbi:serine protease [Providencia rettgeri]|uniref:S1 family peptidase n=2 Tax=Providencia rettgeri TaxID=587 RepID=UPI001C831FBD|nr:serine protease [Providencia rettgeri]MBX6969973.1 serine protease [Providencia rettgeri]MBX6978222.1 serine protease [Providencia rettgeri]MBX6995277.1 serine protease [Providencia rettgeri]MBX7023817.1 serine protease [Providencia rettgeri]MBX7028540.1 serine protease [Providencia rettgeri]